jgi:hypothetical protein
MGGHGRNKQHCLRTATLWSCDIETVDFNKTTFFLNQISSCSRDMTNTVNHANLPQDASCWRSFAPHERLRKPSFGQRATQ